MDVRLVRWPAARVQLDELRAAGIPRLVVVDGDVPAPAPVDDLEDWVRLPADQSDVRLRVDTLAARARSRRFPVLSEEGVLRHGGAAVPLSPVEAGLVGVLSARFGAVVGRADLMAAVWPGDPPPRNALDVQISRLRRRLAAVGLAITTIRGRGYLLDDVADLSETGQQLAANG